MEKLELSNSVIIIAKLYLEDEVWNLNFWSRRDVACL